VATPRKTLGLQTLPPEILNSKDVGRKFIEDEDRRLRDCHLGGQQLENRMSRPEVEKIKAEPVVPDPATERLDDDEDGIWLAESVSSRFDLTSVLRGGGGTRSTSPIDASWVVVDHSSNPATRPQSPALFEHQQSPKAALREVPQLRQTPEARSLDGKSLSSNATRPGVASSPGGPPNPITRAHQIQRPSSPHVGAGRSLCGMNRSLGGHNALPPVKHSRQPPWAQVLQGQEAYSAQNDVVEGTNLREASGGCPDAVANDLASSWCQLSFEEAQHVASSSPNPRRATKRMAMHPEVTREPQMSSFHLMGGITPHQPTYSNKRNAEPDSRSPLLPPEVKSERSGHMDQGVTKFNHQREESRSLQARDIAHDASVSNSKP